MLDFIQCRRRARPGQHDTSCTWNTRFSQQHLLTAPHHHSHRRRPGRQPAPHQPLRRRPRRRCHRRRSPAASRGCPPYLHRRRFPPAEPALQRHRARHLRPHPLASSRRAAAAAEGERAGARSPCRGHHRAPSHGLRSLLDPALPYQTASFIPSSVHCLAAMLGTIGAPTAFVRAVW